MPGRGPRQRWACWPAGLMASLAGPAGPPASRGVRGEGPQHSVCPSGVMCLCFSSKILFDTIGQGLVKFKLGGRTEISVILLVAINAMTLSECLESFRIVWRTSGLSGKILDCLESLHII